ncbi:KRAB-A domain-containing protein 2 [Trichonephila clavipes]|nr:KRAB-A domain-containing protein 2 [Trichonephila clavipes]
MSTYTKYVDERSRAREYCITILYIRTFAGVCRQSQIYSGGGRKERRRLAAFSAKSFVLLGVSQLWQSFASDRERESFTSNNKNVTNLTKKISPAQIGDTVRIQVPDVDRGLTDNQNVLAVVGIEDSNFSKLANENGPFEQLYTRNQFVTCKEKLLSIDEIYFQKISLRESAAANSRSGSDEAHFWLNGYVNKQNCRIWSEANPQVYVETPLHPEKLTVWCALWAGGIIGPYFFKNDEGHNVTVNGDRYRAMITNFFIPELNNHDVQELWFQQDGATCHTARATIDLLKDTFGDRLISRFGPVNWPPRSCDLTPLDYFLWGYVKSLVYADKPQTLDHLEDSIRIVIADIRPQMLEKVIENWTSRLDYIQASRGSHMPETIFKM